MYDTIVIGRDLSSMSAALSSVSEGRKTLMITEGDHVAVHRDAGYAFPLDPRPLLGLDCNVLSHLFGKKSQMEKGVSAKQAMDPAFQVILPDHRLDIFRDWDRLVQEMIREFPEQERGIRNYYRDVARFADLVEQWIVEDLARRRGTFGDFHSSLMRFPHAAAGRSALAFRGDANKGAFRRVVEAQVNFLSHFLEMESSSFPVSAAYLLATPMRVGVAPSGGMTALMDHMRSTFKGQGGILMDGCSVMRVETHPKIAVDLDAGGCPSTHRGRNLIVSALWEKLELLLPVRKIFPGSSRSFTSIYPATYPFSLHMGVHEGGLPESMAPYVAVVRDGTGTFTNQDLVALNTSSREETDAAPAGRRAITCTVYLADSPLRLSDRQLKEIAMGMIDSLEGFLPFLRDSIDYLRVEQSIALARRCQDTVNRKYRMRGRPFFGTRTCSPKTGLANVYLTGGILRAGLGLEGEIIAGIDSAFKAK